MVTDERRAVIHAAAIEVFSANGFTDTSMADIASAAGMSRPALYQYFRDKGDIFVSAFMALLNSQLDAAIAELGDRSQPIEARLDGFLQRFDGDLWDRMAASPHSEGLLAAKYLQLGAGAEEVMARRAQVLAAFFRSLAPGRRAEQAARRAGWIELLTLAPKGFKSDQPEIEVYRSRLQALARSVAADVAATTST